MCAQTYMHIYIYRDMYRHMCMYMYACTSHLDPSVDRPTQRPAASASALAGAGRASRSSKLYLVVRGGLEVQGSYNQAIVWCSKV